jgi:hypothetical protein
VSLLVSPTSGNNLLDACLEKVLRLFLEKCFLVLMRVLALHVLL